jgi:hypothetical protein
VVVSDEVKEAAAAEINRVYDEALRMAEDEVFSRGLLRGLLRKPPNPFSSKDWLVLQGPQEKALSKSLKDII